MDITSLVVAEVGKRRERACEELKRLVSIPSVVGSEGPYQGYVADRFRTMGMEVKVFEPDRAALSTHPAYIEVPWSYEGRPNVVGIRPGGTSGKSVILNAHADVVSPEPVSRWSFDPWGGEVSEGRLYGRGSCDMKGGLTAILLALDSLKDLGVELAGGVQVHSVVEEEAGGGGTLACLLREEFRADGLVIPEPDMDVVVAHAGVLYFRVKVAGRSAHAGRGHLGVNAIHKMNLICDRLRQLDEERGRTVRDPLLDEGGRSCHLNVGTYRAGDWPSTVPGWAQIECRVSCIPGEKLDDIKFAVQAAVREVAAKDEWLTQCQPEVEWFGWHAEPWKQDPDTKLVDCFLNCSKEVLGRPASVRGKAAAMDTRFGQYFGIPALSFGPQGGNIHGVDEWVDLASVVQTAQVIARFLCTWCGVK